MDLIVIGLLMLTGLSLLYWLIRTRLMERRRSEGREIFLAFPISGSDVASERGGVSQAVPSLELDTLTNSSTALVPTDIKPPEEPAPTPVEESEPVIRVVRDEAAPPISLQPIDDRPPISIPRVRQPATPPAIVAVEANGGSHSTAFDDPSLVEGKTIRFHKPTPQTMRLLPGRLEVEEGEDGRSEIRFVDLPGSAAVTFGRLPGQPFRHVQLRSPTVSREHARMEREGSEWIIANLSRTNPIVINGETLPPSEEKRPLRDGDRIEMGEVVFRYYSA